MKDKGGSGRLSLLNFSEQELGDAARHYEERGFLLLDGAEQIATTLFHPILATILHLSDSELQALLDPKKASEIFPAETRRQLARIETPETVKVALLDHLKTVLNRLIGPISHVSSTFHAQFKGNAAGSVDHGGYNQDKEYMELHGPYLLHQDFAGAAIPTSPSMVTLWTPLNTSPFWNLRLYPGSHRQGLLCNKWLDLNDSRLESLGPPVDIQAKEGTAVLFNSMMLHGTSNPGPQRRVSCDIRFFPLCGFLPSEPYLLDQNPLETIAGSLERAPGPVLQSPLLEDLAFLGKETTGVDLPILDVSGYSVLNWVNYISMVQSVNPESAIPFLRAMVNERIGVDEPDVYISKFFPCPVRQDTLRNIRQKIGSASMAPRRLADVLKQLPQ